MGKKSFFGFIKNLYEGRITRSVWFIGFTGLLLSFGLDLIIDYKINEKTSFKIKMLESEVEALKQEVELYGNSN